MTLTLVTAPPALPITLAEAKTQLRVSSTAEDDYITGLIQSAVSLLDANNGITGGRCMVQQTWDWSLDGWPVRDPVYRPYADLVTPICPVRSVDRITYLDLSGTEQTIDATTYHVALGGDWPARIVMKPGYAWPPLYDVPDAATVRLTAGYAPGSASPTDYAENVEPSLKQAVKLLVSHWFDNRAPVNIGNITTTLPMGVDALLLPLRKFGF